MNEPYENQNEFTPWDSEYRYIPPKKEKVKKGWTAGKVIALALSCSLLGGVVGAGGVIFGTQLTETPQTDTKNNVSNVLVGDRESAVIDISKIDTSEQMSPAEVYAANVNSTVGITTSITTNFWGYQTTSAASGSGTR